VFRQTQTVIFARVSFQKIASSKVKCAAPENKRSKEKMTTKHEADKLNPAALTESPTMTDKLLADIAARKAQLDALRPMSREALRGLRKAFDVDLTYTSNAIEGNTLTLRETAELIEHGITVGGKPLRDHLEAVDHYNAVQWMREVAEQATPLDESTVRELHRRIVFRSQPEIGGLYSTFRRAAAGSQAIFPNPVKIPRLMQDFGERLSLAGPDPAESFKAHFDLAAIHPFGDGNGRTARLLMNLMLLRGGYPPVAVRPERGNPISICWNTLRSPTIYSPSRPSCTNDWTPRWGSMSARCGRRSRNPVPMIRPRAEAAAVEKR